MKYRELPLPTGEGEVADERRAEDLDVRAASPSSLFSLDLLKVGLRILPR